MRYDEIDNLLALETSSLDRRRLIASTTQTSATGIIDSPDPNKTTCNKSYWERDTGLVLVAGLLFLVLLELEWGWQPIL